MADVTKITLPNGTTKDIKDTTARSNVVLLETMNGAKNLAPYNSDEHVGNASYWFLHTNCIDIAAGTSLYLVYDYTQTAGQISIQLTDSNGNIISGTSSYSTQGTTSGHKATKITIPSGKTGKGYNAYHSANATVTVSNFMIIPAEIYEAGFTDYQPYALPNTKITPELIELVDSGAKNLIPVTRDEIKAANSGWGWNGYTATNGGITFTLNEDMSITLNGTCTSTVELTLMPRSANRSMFKSAGLYELQCKVPSGSSWFVGVNRTVSGSGVRWGTDSGSGLEFTVNASDVGASDGIWIGIPQGTQINNVTIYPMICSKAAWDVSQKFVPYRMSNAELTKLMPVTLSKRYIPQSADYEIVSDLTISIPAGKKYLVHAMASFNNVAPKGVIINKTNTIAANKNTVFAEITNNTNDFGGLTTSAIMSNTGSTAFDVCIFAKFKSANTSGSDVIVTYQDIT